jgi:hypothetical protein
MAAGDSALLSASNCATGNCFPSVLNGSVMGPVVGGVNGKAHLLGFAQGSAHRQVSHNGTSIGDGRAATGADSLVSSNASAGVLPDHATLIAGMTVAHPGARLRTTGASDLIAGSSRLWTAAGTFDTTVAGIGDVGTVLSVKSPLTVDAGTTRVDFIRRLGR